MKDKAKIFGVGILDANYKTRIFRCDSGNQTLVWKCPFYAKWTDMLMRCYSAKYQGKQPKYKGCYVTDEWLTFSSFRSWMECYDIEDKELDKDLLVDGNKVYSPSTCCLVSGEVNKFLLASTSRKGKYPLGVSLCSRNNRIRYLSRASVNKRAKNLGRFTTPMQAHHAWQKKKLELAMELQSRQDDERVRKGLQRVIDKLKYHIENGIETTSL